MTGRRKRQRYNEVVTGECGHLCNAWPVIRESGASWVICDTCVAKVRIVTPSIQLTLFDDDE